MKTIDHYQPNVKMIEEQKDTISVAVAVYNSDAYLEKAIRSIQNQTYRNLEIILVDDGSTDGCAKLCDDFAKEDSRIKVIHKENGGLFSTRNTGIENATGKYIAFVDGDDYIDADMYEKMLAALIENDADLVTCRYRCVFQDKTVDLSTPKAMIMENQEMLEKYLEEDEKLQIQNAAWNKLYKRSVITQLRFPGRWYEDMLYTVKLLANVTKSVYLDQAFYNYICDRSTSIMNKGLNKRVFSDLIPNLYDRSSFLREIGREDLALLQDYFLYKRLLIFYSQVSASKDKDRAVYMKYLEEKIREGKEAYSRIYAIPFANRNEYTKIKLFLVSPMIYRVFMKINNTIILPLKTKKGK